MSSALSTFNTTTEERLLSKAPKLQMLLGRPALAVPAPVCGFQCECFVHFSLLCVYLDGLNAEHKFQV